MNPPLGPNITPIPLLKLAKTGIPTTPIKTNAKFDKKAYNGDNISPLKKTPNKANEKEIPINLDYRIDYAKLFTPPEQDIKIIKHDFDIIVDKIIRGDLGDNILPVIFRKSKSGSEKQYRVSQKDLNLSLNIHDNIQVKEYFENLLNSKSYKDRVDKSIDMICEHFEYNKKLVVLEEESYPQDILDIMNKYNTYNCNKNITNVENILLADMNKMNNILDFI